MPSAEDIELGETDHVSQMLFIIKLKLFYQLRETTGFNKRFIYDKIFCEF